MCSNTYLRYLDSGNVWPQHKNRHSPAIEEHRLSTHNGNELQMLPLDNASISDKSWTCKPSCKAFKHQLLHTYRLAVYHYRRYRWSNSTSFSVYTVPDLKLPEIRSKFSSSLWCTAFRRKSFSKEKKKGSQLSKQALISCSPQLLRASGYTLSLKPYTPIPKP